ncbi:MAG: matrixin family metalloprotease [Candidatus Melainabacteria bacterium]|nr:matrixin family metalloprotease [Candidatus Melainabacteria bacterium]
MHKPLFNAQNRWSPIAFTALTLSLLALAQSPASAQSPSSTQSPAAVLAPAQPPNSEQSPAFARSTDAAPTNCLHSCLPSFNSKSLNSPAAPSTAASSRSAHPLSVRAYVGSQPRIRRTARERPEPQLFVPWHRTPAKPNPLDDFDGAFKKFHSFEIDPFLPSPNAKPFTARQLCRDDPFAEATFEKPNGRNFARTVFPPTRPIGKERYKYYPIRPATFYGDSFSACGDSFTSSTQTYGSETDDDDADAEKSEQPPSPNEVHDEPQILLTGHAIRRSNEIIQSATEDRHTKSPRASAKPTQPSVESSHTSAKTPQPSAESSHASARPPQPSASNQPNQNDTIQPLQKTLHDIWLIESKFQPTAAVPTTSQKQKLHRLYLQAARQDPHPVLKTYYRFMAEMSIENLENAWSEVEIGFNQSPGNTALAQAFAEEFSHFGLPLDVDFLGIEDVASIADARIVHREYVAGMAALTAHKWKTAKRHLTEVTRLLPTNFWLIESIANSYVHHGHKMDAITVLDGFLRVTRDGDASKSAHLRRDCLKNPNSTLPPDRPPAPEITAQWNADRFPLKVYFEFTPLANSLMGRADAEMRSKGLDAMNDWMMASENRVTLVEVGDRKTADIVCRRVPAGIYTHNAGQTAPTRSKEHELTFAAISFFKDSATDHTNVKQLALHEFGHALGMLRHSSSIKDVMYSTLTSAAVTSPSAGDKDYLLSLYKNYPIKSKPICTESNCNNRADTRNMCTERICTKILGSERTAPRQLPPYTVPQQITDHSNLMQFSPSAESTNRGSCLIRLQNLRITKPALEAGFHS